ADPLHRARTPSRLLHSGLRALRKRARAASSPSVPAAARRARSTALWRARRPAWQSPRGISWGGVKKTCLVTCTAPATQTRATSAQKKTVAMRRPVFLGEELGAGRG